MCHYSLDVDNAPDLKWAKPNQTTPGSPYKPEHAWAIGNQDIALGWIFASSQNTIAGFENSDRAAMLRRTMHVRGPDGFAITTRQSPPISSAKSIEDCCSFRRGFADDTPDGMHNPVQFPSLFTNRNWPYNYDGVMLNASDRNNNV